MELRILGPLEVTVHGRTLDLGPPKQQTLLGVLLLHPRETVSAARLVLEIWGESPPPSAGKALQGYVSGLRKALGTNAIVTRTHGYALAVPPERVDAVAFERAAAAAEAGLAHDAERSAAGFRQAGEAATVSGVEVRVRSVDDADDPSGFELSTWTQTLTLDQS